MFKRIFNTAIVLVLALGGGIWSVDKVLDRFEGFGELKVGVWSAYPAAGTPDADPIPRPALPAKPIWRLERRKVFRSMRAATIAGAPFGAAALTA